MSDPFTPKPMVNGSGNTVNARKYGSSNSMGYSASPPAHGNTSKRNGRGNRDTGRPKNGKQNSSRAPIRVNQNSPRNPPPPNQISPRNGGQHMPPAARLQQQQMQQGYMPPQDAQQQMHYQQQQMQQQQQMYQQQQQQQMFQQQQMYQQQHMQQTQQDLYSSKQTFGAPDPNQNPLQWTIAALESDPYFEPSRVPNFITFWLVVLTQSFQISVRQAADLMDPTDHKIGTALREGVQGTFVPLLDSFFFQIVRTFATSFSQRKSSGRC